MIRNPYSASAVKFSFWFAECKTTLSLLNEGKSFQDIARLSQENNIYLATSQARGKLICSTCAKRLKALNPDQALMTLFFSSDVATQKLINLIAIMASDALFFNLIYTVIKDKLIIGNFELTDSDFRIFFRNIQSQDERAAKWTEATVKKLTTTYKSYLADAGLTDRARSVRQLYRPILDPVLENWLLSHDMRPVVSALTGETR